MKKRAPIILLILIFLAMPLLTNKLTAAGTMNPNTSILLLCGFAVILVFFRPKKKVNESLDEIREIVLGDYAANAFSGNEDLNKKFQSALNAYCGNKPRAALNKLNKLAPLCTTDEEKYAVAMALGFIYNSLREYPDAILECNKALILHPTSELAMNIGSCQQRIGELEKAIASYEFAIDMDPKNVEAYSSVATAWVANRDYEKALEYAMQALEMDENHPSSLATAAICYGLNDDNLMYKHFSDRAEENGYNRKKIEDTVKALKK